MQLLLMAENNLVQVAPSPRLGWLAGWLCCGGSVRSATIELSYIEAQ